MGGAQRHCAGDWVASGCMLARSVDASRMRASGSPSWATSTSVICRCWPKQARSRSTATGRRSHAERRTTSGRSAWTATGRSIRLATELTDTWQRRGYTLYPDRSRTVARLGRYEAHAFPSAFRYTANICTAITVNDQTAGHVPVRGGSVAVVVFPVGVSSAELEIRGGSRTRLHIMEGVAIVKLAGDPTTLTRTDERGRGTRNVEQTELARGAAQRAACGRHRPQTGEGHPPRGREDRATLGEAVAEGRRGHCARAAAAQRAADAGRRPLRPRRRTIHARAANGQGAMGQVALPCGRPWPTTRHGMQR